MLDKTKKLGQVFTPEWLVNEILNASNYAGKDILRHYILEPACGNGRFLCEIVNRYIEVAKEEGQNNEQIINELGEYIIGIEIDKDTYDDCINNLNKILQEKLNINRINWRIYHQDTLNIYRDYLQYFDWIVGNPPYVRLHNLDNITREFIKKEFQFTKGTTDLYLTFFEMAFFMLKPTGKLGFITPNSFLHNTSYQSFRQFLKQQKKLTNLYDLKSNKVFDGYSTYTAITIFDNNYKEESFNYKELINRNFCEVNQINFNDIDGNKWVFSNQKNAQFLKEIQQKNKHQLQDFFNVQYGFATLRDRIFISKSIYKNDEISLFNGEEIENKILRPVVKGSKYKGSVNEIESILFPYFYHHGRYVAYSEEALSKQFPLAYAYLLKNKSELLTRDTDKKAQWFEFGRSQGLQTSHQEKIVVSTLVNGQVIFFRLPKEILVYSGIFITKKNQDIDWEIVENILSSDEFLQYVRLTGKDMSGGYKSLSSKQIKSFYIPNAI